MVSFTDGDPPSLPPANILFVQTCHLVYEKGLDGKYGKIETFK